MLAIGNGVQAYIERQISSLGTNLLIVNAGAARSGGGFAQGIGSAPTLTLDDAEAIARMAGIGAAAPISSFSTQAVAGPANWLTSVTASTSAWFQVQDWFPDQGRAFTEMENRQAARVAVLGQKAADELFGANDPIGRQVRVRGISFAVIGILPSKGQGIGGADRDDMILLPLNSAQRMVQGGGAFRRSIRTIMVTVERQDELESVQEQITQLLRRRHRLAPSAVDDFNITNVSALGACCARSSGTPAPSSCGRRSASPLLRDG
jgi:putative ABC transport system permease protein